MVTIRNKFDTHQETSERYSSNGKYEKFVTAHLEAAAECIPIKSRVKCRVSQKHLGKNMKKSICS